MNAQWWTPISRRRFLRCASLLGVGWLASRATSRAAPVSSRYKIAVCDWMILKRQKLGAFQLTKEIGADGVEVDMGPLGDRETFDSPITTNAVLRQQFLD